MKIQKGSATEGEGLGDTSICVVGKRHFNNELLVKHLSRKKGIPCCKVNNLHGIFGYQQDVASRRFLALIDFDNIQNEGLGQFYLSLNDQRFKHILLAFYNLPVDSDIERKALDAGICGFFYENDTIESVCKGVDAIFRGEIWITRKKMIHCLLKKSSDISLAGGSSESSYSLTPREKEILCLISKGFSNEKIASELFISPHTVKTHLYKSYKKIEVSDRLQAALWATKNLMPKHYAGSFGD